MTKPGGKMTKLETRMTNQIQNSNDETKIDPPVAVSSYPNRPSSLIRHSNFVIRISALIVFCMAFALAMVSCQDTASGPVATVNTMWASTVPSTQTARLLGFSFPPAPAEGRASDDEVAAFSRSCIACHNQTDNHTMHDQPKSLRLA